MVSWLGDAPTALLNHREYEITEPGADASRDGEVKMVCPPSTSLLQSPPLLELFLSRRGNIEIIVDSLDLDAFFGETLGDEVASVVLVVFDGTNVADLELTGFDAVNEGSGGAITAFCNAHSIPLITTYKAKGLMDERDPLCLGGAGLSPRADKVTISLMIYGER